MIEWRDGLFFSKPTKITHLGPNKRICLVIRREKKKDLIQAWFGKDRLFINERIDPLQTWEELQDIALYKVKQYLKECLNSIC